MGRYCSYLLPMLAGGTTPNSYLQNLANDGMPNSVHRLIPSAVLITAYTSPVGQSLPYLESFTIAQRSVRELQALIRRRPKIDVFSSAGKKPKAAIGNIEFRDVHFNYRTRPTVKVRQSKYPEVYISLLEEVA